MQEYPGQLLCNYHDVFVVYRGAEVPARGVTPANPGTVDVADNWDMALGTPTKFIVQRSAGALKEDTTKLELPVNLALAKCYNDGTQDVPCGDGKYLVKSVTAHPWSGSGTSSVGAMTDFFFVGEQASCWAVQDPAARRQLVVLEITTGSAGCACEYRNEQNATCLMWDTCSLPPRRSRDPHECGGTELAHQHRQHSHSPL